MKLGLARRSARRRGALALLDELVATPGLLADWAEECGAIPLDILSVGEQSTDLDGLLAFAGITHRSVDARIVRVTTLEEQLARAEAAAALYTERPPAGLLQTLALFPRSRLPNLPTFLAQSETGSRLEDDQTAYSEGPTGIRSIGHRQYVGGLWDEIGRLQFDYLVARGLTPDDVLLDVACGSLRGGIHFIPYLAPGHYLGIDKEGLLVQAGLRHELGLDSYAERRPEFVISDGFEFGRFTVRPSFAIAQSLFSHLAPVAIERCLEQLRPAVTDNHRFYATFFEELEGHENPDSSHSHARFCYAPEALAALGEKHGWAPEYLGDWGHPRGQVLICFSAA